LLFKKAFEFKIHFLREQKLALKDTFFPIYFTIQITKSLRTNYFIIKCHIGREWGKKSAKNVSRIIRMAQKVLEKMSLALLIQIQPISQFPHEAEVPLGGPT